MKSLSQFILDTLNFSVSSCKTAKDFKTNLAKFNVWYEKHFINDNKIIELIPFEKNHLIPKNGKYLVKTESTHMKTIHFIEARCMLVGEGTKLHTAVDVSNQIVLEISKEPLI